MYLWKQYWTRLADAHAHSDAQGLAPVLHPDVPAWFNTGIDRLQARAWSRAVGGLPLASDKQILDVGCGTGRWLRRYGERGLRAVGVDATPGMLSRALELRPGSAVAAGLAEGLPFRSASFDAVSSVTVVQHLAPHAQENALAEFARILRAGGHLLLFELIRGRDTHIFPRAPQEWIRAAAAHDLRVVRWFGEEFLPLDRMFVWLAQRVRSRVVPSGPDGNEEPVGAATAARPPESLRNFYWSFRHLVFGLSAWMEPLAESLSRADWATHGVFVFQKTEGHS